MANAVQPLQQARKEEPSFVFFAFLESFPLNKQKRVPRVQQRQIKSSDAAVLRT